MEADDRNNRLELKIIFIFSVSLIFLDIYELNYLYYSIINYSTMIIPDLFEKCVKYHIITQMFFIVFAALAGISACILCLGILIDYETFSSKLLETFIYYNFYAFGPILLGFSVFIILNFSKICNFCDEEDYTKQFTNYISVICLVIVFVISIVITFWYCGIYCSDYFCNSIRFNGNGNYYLGKLFWKLAFNRGTQLIRDRIDNKENQENQDNLIIEENIESLDREN